MKRDAMPLQTSVVICDNPFQTFIEPHQVRAAREFETLAEMAPTTPGDWLCVVGDRCIPPDQWHYYPKPGSVVQFRAIPQGGDDKGTSRSILTLIAVIAINTLVPGADFAAVATKVGLTLAATALINNLIPIEAPKADKQRYTAQSQGNAARIGGVIPEQFGYDDGFPDLCAQPYNLYPTRVTQVLHVLMCLGEGQIHVCRVSNGDTDLLNYDEVDIVRVGPGQSTMDGPGTGYEDLDDQSIIDPRWVTNPDSSLVEMRPGNYTGPYTVCGPGRTVDTIGIDLVQPRGMSREVRMRWRNEAQLIDDFDQPLGPWIVLGSHTTTQQSNGPRYIITGDETVPAGRYWVRTIRTDEIDEENLESIDQLSILAIRGHLVNGSIDFDGTMVGVRVRVNGQINGSLRFRVRSYRMLPVWDGSTWSAPQITRNPAWALAHIGRTRGVPDARIDLAQLLTLEPVWDARFDSFDYKFGEQVSMWDAMALAAKVGRAVPLIRGSRYTVVRDALETLPAASYSMRNIVRSSVVMKPALATSDQMRSLDLEYFDGNRQEFLSVTAQIHNDQVYGYRTETEVASRAALGIPAPDENRRGRWKVSGIIGFNHAMRTCLYMLADRYYRNVDIDYDVEMDGQIPCPLNLVQWQHEIGDFGQTGDVVSWDDGTLTLETTEPLVWTEATHAISFTRPTGAPTITIRATQGINDFQMVLDSGDYAAAVAACTADQRGEFEIVTLDADRDRTRYVFGPLTRVGALAKVRGIKPSDERRNGMSIVLEDNRVHTVDALWIAPDVLPECVVQEIETPLIIPELLLHFNGNFYDDSYNHHTVSEAGSIVDGLYGGALELSGGFFLGVTINPMNFGGFTVEWSIECWVNFSLITGSDAIWAFGTTGQGMYCHLVSGVLYVGFIDAGGGGNVLSPSWVPSTGVWYHLLVQRRVPEGESTNQWECAVDGVWLETSDDPMPTGTLSRLLIGARPAESAFFNGLIDDFRVVYNDVPYRSFPDNFVPPAAELPNPP
jgi:hypothetical protein